MWVTRVVVLLIIHYYCVCCVFGKRYETRCKLVRELLRVGVPNDLFLGQWVCLIEKASNRNTSAYTVSPSGKKFYGLYQIPNQWCKEGKRGGTCNIKCEDLLDEDIRDDTTCAMTIYQQEGFKYWPSWNTRCKNDNFITNEIYKSDSEFDHPLHSSTTETLKSSKKRKQAAPKKSSATMRSKTPKTSDVFGVSRRNADSDSSTSTSAVLSYFVNRVANGTERRTANTVGHYHVDLKVYATSDVRTTEPMELWKKALVRIKFQTDDDSTQWRKLQNLVESLDEVFDGASPRFSP